MSWYGKWFRNNVVNSFLKIISILIHPIRRKKKRRRIIGSPLFLILFGEKKMILQ